MEIKGKILEIAETQQVKDNFRKREFILEYSENDKFIEYLKFETIQDKCEILDDFSAGAAVEVSFNLRGRAWEDKTGKKSYFNSLQAWRIKNANESAGQGVGTGNSAGIGSGANSGIGYGNVPSNQGNYGSSSRSQESSQDNSKTPIVNPGGNSESATSFPPSEEDDLPF